jgi:lysyl endopeptidase
LTILSLIVGHTQAYEKPAPFSQDNDSSSGRESQSGPVQIGEHHTDFIISTDPTMSHILPTITGNGHLVWTLEHPSASYIAVHFQSLNLHPTCALSIKHADNTAFDELYGQGRNNRKQFWAHHVLGNLMNVELICSSNHYELNAFTIDDYVSGFHSNIFVHADGDQNRQRNLKNYGLIFGAEEKLPSFDRRLSVCGADERENAVCFKKSFPAEYDKARAVARLYINGSGACTGWLVGPNNFLLSE